MKNQIFFFSLIYSIFCCCNPLSVNNKHDIYKKAFDIILLDLNNSTSESSKEEEQIKVSNEIIKFNNFSFQFKTELERYNGFEIEDFLFDSKQVSSLNDKIKDIGAKKSIKNQLFFSEEKSSFFFAELFLNQESSHFKYEDKPNFGSSYVYLFKIKGKEVLMISKKELIYG